MPTPNMPMDMKYRTSFQAGGSGNPSQTIAWTSTAMPHMPATDAAMVCM